MIKYKFTFKLLIINFIYFNNVYCGKVKFNMSWFAEQLNTSFTCPTIFEDSWETDTYGNNVTMTYPYDRNTTVHYYGPDNHYKIPARAFVRHLSNNNSEYEPAWAINLTRFYSQRYCAFSHRVHLIFYHNNITHDTVYINTQNKPKWYNDQFYPNKVPLLSYNNIPITDSLLIADYLNIKYPAEKGPLCHEDAFYQNDDNVMLAEEFEDVAWAMRHVLMAETVTHALYANLTKSLKYFERELHKRDTIFWFGNERPGMTDYMMWPWFERLAAIPVHTRFVFPNPLIEFPRLLRWEQHMLKDNAVQSHYLAPESYVEYFRRRRKGLPLFDPPF